MLFNIGDIVTRKSHNNDVVFKITNIKQDTVYLKGINIRLIADAPINDLEKCNECEDSFKEEDRDLTEKIYNELELNRDEYFYLPGKVLHIDADKDYLDRCMSFYKKMNVLSYGFVFNEDEVPNVIKGYLEKIRPDVLVITGHDAFYDNGKDYLDLDNYKNSKYYIDSIREARKYEKDPEKLIIIAGACQSNYEELIKAGANFASSPKRINIHALDPGIIASSICLSKKNEPIDLLNILKKTKYGKEGIGGIITNGVMYVGYPR